MQWGAKTQLQTRKMIKLSNLTKVQETEFPAGVLEGQSPSNFPHAIRFPDPLKIMQRERIPTAPRIHPKAIFPCLFQTKIL
jgi:hypothetical protein